MKNMAISIYKYILKDAGANIVYIISELVNLIYEILANGNDQN